MCAIVVAVAYGVPWILNRLSDGPIMRKRINEGSDRWDSPRIWRPDPRKFRKIVDETEKEEDEDEFKSNKGYF